MQPAHYHLLFNHLPIIIPAVGLAVLILGFLTRSEVVKRTAYFVLILGAIGTLPAFFTGEGAEEAIEHLPEISKKIIHAHEEKAETFALLSYLLGVLSLIALWANWKKKSFSSLLSYLVVVCVLVVLVLAQQTGTSGGEIRHTEIRSDFTSTQAAAGENDAD